MKWAVELSEFDLHFKIRVAIIGQTLMNFVAKFANALIMEETLKLAEPPIWNLLVEGFAGEASSGVGMVLVNPEGHKLNFTMQFGSKATDKVVEYETLLVVLWLAREMQVRRLLINGDSQLIVSQVNHNFIAWDKSMATYLKLVSDLLISFKKFELTQIPHVENTNVDTLSKLASSKDLELLTVVPIEHLIKPPLLRRR